MKRLPSPSSVKKRKKRPNNTIKLRKQQGESTKQGGGTKKKTTSMIEAIVIQDERPAAKKTSKAGKVGKGKKVEPNKKKGGATKVKGGRQLQRSADSASKSGPLVEKFVEGKF